MRRLTATSRASISGRGSGPGPCRAAGGSSTTAGSPRPHHRRRLAGSGPASGSGTAARTRSSNWSAVTPSLSASYERTMPVTQDVRGQVATSSGNDVTAAAEQREHPCGRDEADRPARARAELDQRRDVGAAGRGRRLPGRVGKRDARNRSPRGRRAPFPPRPQRCGDRSSASTSWTARRRPQATAHDGGLLAVRRVVDEDLHHEAVELRLGQRVSAFRLDRVLRGHHEERLRAPHSWCAPIVTWAPASPRAAPTAPWPVRG